MLIYAAGNGQKNYPATAECTISISDMNDEKGQRKKGARKGKKRGGGGICNL